MIVVDDDVGDTTNFFHDYKLHYLIQEQILSSLHHHPKAAAFKTTVKFVT